MILIYNEGIKAKKPHSTNVAFLLLWAHLGSNQAPTDYESVALTE